jgi:uncharacterized cupin superfamily protein
MGRFDATDNFVPTPSEETGTEVLEGQQNARIHTFLANDHVFSGLSMADPHVCRTVVANPSMMTLLKGELEFTIDGVTTQMGPGDVFFCQPGAEILWRIKTPILDWFYYHGPFDDDGAIPPVDSMLDLVALGRLDATDGFVPTLPEETGTVVLEGKQNARLHTFVANEHVNSGLSMADPHRFQSSVESPTMLALLEGATDFELNGETFSMSAGDVAFFEPGASPVWTVKTPVRDWYIIQGPFEE